MRSESSPEARANDHVQATETQRTQRGRAATKRRAVFENPYFLVTLTRPRILLRNKLWRVSVTEERAEKNTATSEAAPQTGKHVGPLRLARPYVVLPRLRRGSRLDGENLTQMVNLRGRQGS